MTKLKGLITNSQSRSNDGIARAILQDMGADNGCQFVPCKRHWKQLWRLVGECWAQGLFEGDNADEQISTIAYGEQTEQYELLKKYPSGLALGRCLNRIFDGCKRCESQLPLQEAVSK